MLKLRKRTRIYIILTITFIVLFSIHSRVVGTSSVWSLHSLWETFHSSLLPKISDNLKSSYNSVYLNPLNSKTSVTLKQNNVKFEFAFKRKGTTPEEIVDENMKKYTKMMQMEVNKPQDAILVAPPQNLATYKHANATIIALVRNAESGKLGQSIKRFQKSFNDKFNYPYTFINDQPFTDKFKERIKRYTNDAPVEFVTINPKNWDKPQFIDEAKEAKEMQIMHSHDVAYAQKASYHNMCRFYSGSFYNLPELQKYKYYWRIEPQVDFYSDVTYDVFKYMEATEKIYGFVIGLYDIEETVKSLWPETLKYLNTGDNYKYVNENGSFQWLIEDLQNPERNKVAGGYSTCHFWSNFEIGDMDFFRSEAYNNWFKYLDSTGGFYYERWGDAPVHSIGVSLFADKSKIHWFRDLGYSHDPYFNCANTPFTKGCSVGKFSKYEHLNNHNCLMNWLEYDNIKDVYKEEEKKEK